VNDSKNVTLDFIEKVLNENPNNAEAWRLKGDFLFEKTSFFEALHCYEKSVTYDPQYLQAWMGKGMVSIFQNNAMDALQCFELSIFLTNRKFAEAFRLKSHSYMWNKNNKKKINNCLENAIKLEPENIDVLISKALFLQKMGDVNESISLHEKILSVDKSNLISLLNLKKLNNKSLKKEQTINFVISQKGFSQSESTNLKQYANYFLLHYDFDNAFDFYSYVLDQNPSDFDSVKKQSIISLKRNNIKKGLELISFYLDKVPDDSDVWARKGEILRRQNRMLEAINCFDRAIKIDPKNSEAWRRKGFAQSMRHEDTKSAIRCLDASLRIDPYHPMTLIQKALFLKRLNPKSNDALKILDKAIEIDPTFILAWKEKSVLYISVNDYESALVCFENLMKLDSDDMINWYNTGVTQAKLSEIEFQKAIKFMKNSDYVSALNSLEKILKYDHEDLESHVLKADSLLHLGKKEESVKELKKTLELDPKNNDIQNKINKIEKNL